MNLPLGTVKAAYFSLANVFAKNLRITDKKI